MTVLLEVPFLMFQRIMEETSYDLGAIPDIVIDLFPIEYGGRWVGDEWNAIEFESEKQRDWFVLRWS
jgi:hypothetical protein